VDATLTTLDYSQKLMRLSRMERRACFLLFAPHSAGICAPAIVLKAEDRSLDKAPAARLDDK
jgi:hypothetical protein